MRDAALAMVVLLGSACGLPHARSHRNYPPPISAEALAQLNSGDGVVSYLRQRDADPSVCDPAALGPHVALPTPRDVEDLVDGVGRGARLDKWQACVRAMLAKAPPALGRVLLDRLLDRYIERIAYPHLDRDPEIVAQLEAIERVHSERPPGRDPSRDAVVRASARLQELAHDETVSRLGHLHRARLVATLYLERGLLPDGSRVTIGALDRLLARSGEAELVILSRRLPDARLRGEAARRLVRLRIARSPFDVVRRSARDVEERVLAEGRNVVSLRAHPPASVVVQPSAFPVRGLVVVQDLFAQRAHLYSWRRNERNVSVVPAIDLRGAVLFQIPDIGPPITLCASREELLPDPCVDAAELRIGVPFVRLERDGEFRFAEQIAMNDVLRLARAGYAAFRLPLQLDERTLVQIEWPLRFRHRGPAVFASGDGEPGPDVRVVVDATGPSYLTYEMSANGSGPLYAVVEASDAGAYYVAAAGGSGASGEPGRAGDAGFDGPAGQSASCPSTAATSGGAGGPGGAGGNGGPGGDGGPGGSVQALVRCTAQMCARWSTVVRSALSAPGGRAGAGGAAGSGGRGGRGGSGGAGASCTRDDGTTFSLPAGSNGADGPAGSDGSPGRDGAPGRPGRVALDVQVIGAGG